MARSGYQYETSPRKLEPDYRPQKRKKQVKVKQPEKKKTGGLCNEKRR